MKIMSETWKKRIGILLMITAGFIFISLLFACLKKDIWYDEVFSVCFARHSYADIVSLTAQDVHPPLYYFYLRFVYGIVSHIIPQIGEITVYKLASLIPVAGIGAYILCFARKKMNLLQCGIFLCLMMLMPQLSAYMLEIRMYSLAMFLVTAAFLHACAIVFSGKKVHWICFWMYGILTAYTQYYACVAIIALYIALCIYFIVQKKENRGQFKWWIGCVFTSILAYLPWLPILQKQITSVSASYWIEPLSLRSIAGCMKFVFLPVSYDITIDYVLAVLMIVSCMIALFLVWKQKMQKEEYFYVLTGLFVPIFVFAVGFLCSVVNRPIFIYRYLIPTLGVFWLVIAFTLGKNYRRWLAILLLIPFLLGGYFNLKGLYAEENKKQIEMEHTEKTFLTIPQDAVLIANFNHVQAVAGFYLENEVLLYENEPEELIGQLLPNCNMVADDAEVKNLVKNGPVYFFGSFQSREEITEKWRQQGIQVTELDSCLLERYWFNIYLLEMEK